MKKIVLGIMVMVGIFAGLVSTAWSGELDILVDKLVEKGVLSSIEAQIILDETKKEIAKELAVGQSTSVPSWVQNMKLKGDVRLRYQNSIADNSVDRNRFRIRYRLGVLAKVGDDWEVGAGLATGGSDPRSTNETLDDVFSTKGINLDYAYAKYEPNGWFNAIAGKFKRKEYLWNPTDLLWDGDINPEGISLHADLSGPGDAETFINTGAWILDEYSGDSNDPAMFYVQGGTKWKGDALDAKLAGTYYGFINSGSPYAQLTNNAGTNTLNNNGVYEYDYDSIGISAEFGVKGSEVGLPVGRVAVFGDYIHNPDPGDDDTGYALGFKFGDKKVQKKGTWQLKYIYANLERDAWLDTFPDSDRFGGRTDVKSHEVALNYALSKNVLLGLDYYTSERISNSADTEEIIQVDLNLKF